MVLLGGEVGLDNGAANDEVLVPSRLQAPVAPSSDPVNVFELWMRCRCFE